MATDSSILIWRIPWTEGPGEYNPWSRRESDTTETTWHASIIIISKEKGAAEDEMVR